MYSWLCSAGLSPLLVWLLVARLVIPFGADVWLLRPLLLLVLRVLFPAPVTGSLLNTVNTRALQSTDTQAYEPQNHTISTEELRCSYNTCIHIVPVQSNLFTDFRTNFKGLNKFVCLIRSSSYPDLIKK